MPSSVTVAAGRVILWNCCRWSWTTRLQAAWSPVEKNMLWHSGHEKAKPSASFSRVISMGPYFTCTDILSGG